MYQRNVGIRIGGPITSGVKLLMIIHVIVLIIQKFADIILPAHMLEYIFGISYNGLFVNLWIWQPFTYMFLHGGLIHIIFNLIGLWMFAGELEIEWGRKKFIKYYILSGIGAGLFISLMNYIAYKSYGSTNVTIGASGAIYAILLAYAMLWPNREVLLYFILPIKIKYLVLAFGLIEFFGTLSTAAGDGGNISHIGHLGGIITGFFLVYFMKKSKSQTKNSDSFFERFNKKSRLDNQKKIIDTRIEAKRIIDSLLEKIAREGMNSLTPEEKKKLEWARKNYSHSNTDTLH
jgi:membrane associated rhomboid family serine protease